LANEKEMIGGFAIGGERLVVGLVLLILELFEMIFHEYFEI
jgi:hypothetical protein